MPCSGARLPMDAPATSSSLNRRLRWRVLSGPLRAGLDQFCTLANRGLPGQSGACGSLRGRGRAGLRACAPGGSALAAAGRQARARASRPRLGRRPHGAGPGPGPTGSGVCQCWGRWRPPARAGPPPASAATSEGQHARPLESRRGPGGPGRVRRARQWRVEVPSARLYWHGLAGPRRRADLEQTACTVQGRRQRQDSSPVCLRGDLQVTCRTGGR